jgi:ABC-type proline/glycine betaine transport system substrate-binding protein
MANFIKEILKLAAKYGTKVKDAVQKWINSHKPTIEKWLKWGWSVTTVLWEILKAALGW